MVKHLNDILSDFFEGIAIGDQFFEQLIGFTMATQVDEKQIEMLFVRFDLFEPDR